MFLNIWARSEDLSLIRRQFNFLSLVFDAEFFWKPLLWFFDAFCQKYTRFHAPNLLVNQLKQRYTVTVMDCLVANWRRHYQRNRDVFLFFVTSESLFCHSVSFKTKIFLIRLYQQIDYPNKSSKIWSTSIRIPENSL